MQKRKKTIFILVIILLFLVMNPRTLEYLNTKLVNSRGDMLALKEIELPHSSQIIYEKFNNGVLQYWDGILYYHDMTGEQLWTVHLGVINPIVKTANNSIYIMDNNKKQLTRLNKNGETIYRSILDKTIYNFSVSNNHNVLLQEAQEETPFRYLIILNSEGKKTGEISSGDGKIMRILIDSTSNQILIHTLNTSNNRLENNLLQYDLRGRLLSLESLEDRVLLDYFYEGKGNLVLIFEEGISAIDKNKNIKWEISTERIKNTHKQAGEYLVIYNSNTQKSGIIYGKSPEKLQVISETGEVLGETILKEKPLGIDSNKGDLVYYSNRTIYVGNKKGEWTTEFKYNSDIEKAFIFPQKHIVIITKEKLSFLKF